MCGIVGFMTTKRGQEEFDRKRFLASALQVDTVRGADSTGMFLAPHSKLVGVSPAVLRGTCDGYAFVNDEAYKKQVNNLMDYWAVVGHNRAATKGSISIKNTHPFSRGPITLVHNGTVHNAKTLSEDTDAEVDSDQICSALAAGEIDKVVEVIHGSFALVWHDKRDGKMRFLRNPDRPLHLAPASDGETIYFASEPEMLWYLVKRAGAHVQGIFQPLPGTLMEFSREALMAPTTRTIQLKTYGTYGVAQYGAANAPFAGTSGDTLMNGTVRTRSAFASLSSALVDELRKFRVIPDCSYSFIPHSYSQTPGSATQCKLSGFLPAIQRNGVIYDIHTSVGSAALVDKSPVTVKIVGLRYVAGNDGTSVPVFICDYRARGPGNDTLYEQSYQLPVAGTIIGPNGKLFSYGWWNDAVNQGCSECGVLIVPEDAPNITWLDVGEGKSVSGGRWNPVCAACSPKLSFDTPKS